MQYTPPPHVTQHWLLSKPSAKGRRGMVVSQAKGAAEAGVAVLDAGGNAIDAAVATAEAGSRHARAVEFRSWRHRLCVGASRRPEARGGGGFRAARFRRDGSRALSADGGG